MAGPPDNAELLRVMALAAARFDAEVERSLVGALAGSSLVVPVQVDPRTGASGLWATADEAGRTQVVAFTDAAALAAWAGAEARHAVVAGPDLCRTAVASDAAALWINPAGPHGGRLERRMVDVVAAGETLSFEGADAATRTMRLATTGRGELRVRAVREPPPAAAVERAREAIAAAPGVEAAWLLEATEPPPAHLLLVLLLSDDADAEGATAALRPAVAGLVAPDRFVDVLPVRAGDDDVLARVSDIGLALAGP